MRLSHLLPLCLLFATNSLVAAHPQLSAVSTPDTVNRLDETGRKQGWWRIIAPRTDKPDYSSGQLIEEGRYVNNKREGVWRRYWPNGKTMSEITYAMGQPRGAYTTFYPDGRTEEQGSWDLDRNTGAFKRWHPNGQLAQDFIFNQYGVRDGVQRYYHENGKLEVEVRIHEGKEEGTLKRYYANGDLQQVAEFNNGVINAENSRYLRPAHKVEAPAPEPTAAVAPARSADEVTNSVVFRENGFNTLYDKQLRLSQQGEFRNGTLWNGKYYRYSQQGLIYRIDVYIDGRLAGQAPINEEEKGR